MYQHSTKQCHQHPTQRSSDKVGGTLELGTVIPKCNTLNWHQLITSRSTLLLKKLVTAKLLKKFLCLSWNHNIHYFIPNSLPLDTIQSQMKLVHNFSHYHYKIHFNTMFLSRPVSSKSSPSFRFSHNFFKKCSFIKF